MRTDVWTSIGNGVHEVSTDGRVRSVNRYTHSNPSRFRRGVELKLNKTGNGYLAVCLRRAGGHRQQVMVHALVAKAFIGERPKCFDINHKNGIKTDNRSKNLEYISRSENLKHAYRTGLKRALKGDFNPQSKLTGEQVKVIKNSLSKGVAMTVIAKRFGVAPSTISEIKYKRNWRHI